MDVKRSLDLTNIGPLDSVHLEFGDLTVLVGPQASGKSIALQLLKLVVDNGAILRTLVEYGRTWPKADPAQFLELFLGEGMGRAWDPAASGIKVDGQELDLQHHVRRLKWGEKEQLFYIPAQRVLTLERGWPRPFRDYRAGDPFVVADFSDKLLRLVDDEFARLERLFPLQGRLKAELREALNASIFHGFQLMVEESGRQKRLVLVGNGAGSELPYMVWSAGQREFVPLLLGQYWLMPPTKVSRRADLEWAVIEEPEAGLHPRAVGAVLMSVLELLVRGYKVCLSTHSPAVMDLVWALKVFERVGAEPSDVIHLLGAKATGPVRRLAEVVLAKSVRVFYFDPDARRSMDISELNPESADEREAGWGGLTAFSGRVADVVAECVNRAGARVRR